MIAASLDEPARFGEIFDRHAAAIHRYLLRRIGPDDADELCAEAFRIAFERRATYDPTRASAAPWLYGIATNLLARRRRREARRLRAVARLAARRPATVDPSDAVGDALDAGVEAIRVAEAVAALPDTERDVLLLVVWESFTYEQAAEALAIPVGTVRSRLHRARRRVAADRPSPDPDPDEADDAGHRPGGTTDG
ncbi:MAG: RNA polymerase sigma factor [Actinomycetota bacterium]|nr:RNA polymerase sigma factor [Actinomycetota bacterium]